MIRKQTASTLACAAVFICGIGCLPSTHAQALPPGVHLGMSADALLAALPDAQRVQRPRRLAGGLVGSWRSMPQDFCGLLFEPVFYFGGGQLKRFEWSSTGAEADAASSAYADIVAWGRSIYGPELSSTDAGSAYAAWVQGDTDLYVQRIDEVHRSTVRLVYKVRQLKDGREL